MNPLVSWFWAICLVTAFIAFVNRVTLWVDEDRRDGMKEVIGAAYKDLNCDERHLRSLLSKYVKFRHVKMDLRRDNMTPYEFIEKVISNRQKGVPFS